MKCSLELGFAAREGGGDVADVERLRGTLRTEKEYNM
jgi:hypothetical protein